MSSGPLHKVMPKYRRDGKNPEANDHQGIHNFPKQQEHNHHSGFNTFIRKFK